eukprot:403353258
MSTYLQNSNEKANKKARISSRSKSIDPSDKKSGQVHNSNKKAKIQAGVEVKSINLFEYISQSNNSRQQYQEDLTHSKTSIPFNQSMLTDKTYPINITITNSCQSSARQSLQYQSQNNQRVQSPTIHNQGEKHSIYEKQRKKSTQFSQESQQVDYNDASTSKSDSNQSQLVSPKSQQNKMFTKRSDAFNYQAHHTKQINQINLQTKKRQSVTRNNPHHKNQYQSVKQQQKSQFQSKKSNTQMISQNYQSTQNAVLNFNLQKVPYQNSNQQVNIQQISQRHNQHHQRQCSEANSGTCQNNVKRPDQIREKVKSQDHCNEVLNYYQNQERSSSDQYTDNTYCFKSSLHEQEKEYYEGINFNGMLEDKEETFEDFDADISERDISPMNEERNYLSKAVATSIQDYQTPKSKLMLEGQIQNDLENNQNHEDRLRKYSPVNLQNKFNNVNKNQNQQQVIINSNRSTSQSRQQSSTAQQNQRISNKVIMQDTEKHLSSITNQTHSQMNTLKSQVTNEFKYQTAKKQLNQGGNNNQSNFTDEDESQFNFDSSEKQAFSPNSYKNKTQGNNIMSQVTNNHKYKEEYNIDKKLRKSFEASPSKHNVSVQFKSLMQTHVEIVTLKEENQALSSVNNNLNSKIDNMTQKTIEIDRAINNLRVEILTVNTQRLSAKEQRESDLFAKDMERMELKIEVTTLKESIEEEIQENQSEIQQQKCEIQTLKDLIANAKERCEKYKAEVRRSRAIEQERMKEVKTNQKKLNIFIKQNQPNSYKNKSSTLDQELVESLMK